MAENGEQSAKDLKNIRAWAKKLGTELTEEQAMEILKLLPW